MYLAIAYLVATIYSGCQVILNMVNEFARIIQYPI